MDLGTNLNNGTIRGGRAYILSLVCIEKVSWSYTSEDREILLEKGRQKLYFCIMHNDTKETPIACKYRGMTIVTDPYKSKKKAGAVFPLFREPFYLVDHLDIPKGGVVLDLCTGSGIIALFAAKKAGKVIATDINPRALAMAHFNARINHVDKKIEFRQGDMFNPVEGLLFDLIIASPPYQGKKSWISEKRLTEAILKNADKHLRPKGSLDIIVYMPDEFLYLLDSLKERFRKLSVVFLGRNEHYEGENYLFIRASTKKDNS
jgi:SAM-dependent methyltransferase